MRGGCAGSLHGFERGAAIVFGCASVNVPIVLSTSSHNSASITGRRGCCSAALAPAVAMPKLAEVTLKYLRSAYLHRAHPRFQLYARLQDATTEQIIALHSLKPQVLQESDFNPRGLVNVPSDWSVFASSVSSWIVYLHRKAGTGGVPPNLRPHVSSARNSSESSCVTVWAASKSKADPPEQTAETRRSEEGASGSLAWLTERVHGSNIASTATAFPAPSSSSTSTTAPRATSYPHARKALRLSRLPTLVLYHLSLCERSLFMPSALPHSSSPSMLLPSQRPSSSIFRLSCPLSLSF